MFILTFRLKNYDFSFYINLVFNLIYFLLHSINFFVNYVDYELSLSVIGFIITIYKIKTIIKIKLRKWKLNQLI